VEICEFLKIQNVDRKLSIMDNKGENDFHFQLG